MNWLTKTRVFLLGIIAVIPALLWASLWIVNYLG